jgi:hypothetical protein
MGLPVLGGDREPTLLGAGVLLGIPEPSSAQRPAGARRAGGGAGAGELRSAPGAAAPGPTALESALWGRASSTTYVFLGVEAVALYASLRSGGDGSLASSEVARGAATVATPAAAALVSADGSVVPDPAGVEFLAALARDRRAVAEWRGAAPAGTGGSTDGGALAAVARTSPLAFVNRIADRISGVTSALRGLQLTSLQVSENTRLRLDARTGRQKRCYFVLTSRF